MFSRKTFAAIVFTTVAVAAGAGLPSDASAKDWIEKVEVKRDGIDTKAIHVSANMGGYTKIKTKNHRFLLGLYAKATKGKRIVAMKVGSFKGVLYFEADGDLWSKSFANRDVGSGSKRTVKLNYTPTLSLKKVKWVGSGPKKCCDLNMQKLRKQGMSKTQILSKTHSVKAYAYFELDAVAARKNKAKKGWKMSNTTNQRDGYNYEVRVVCGSRTNKVGG